MRRSLDTSINETLRLNTAQVLNAIEIEDGELELPESFIEDPETVELLAKGFLLRTLNSDGSVLQALGSYKTLPVTDEALAAGQNGETNLTTLTDQASGDSIRVYSVPIRERGVTVGMHQVGQDLEQVEETLQFLLSTFIIGGPILVIAAGIGGYLLAARALSPIDQVTRTARRISAADLSARIEPTLTDDEVGRLSATFNEMLARLEKAFQREKQFTTDASHELRTPLAAMQAILDVTSEKRRTNKDYQVAIADTAEENKKLMTIAEALLLLARMEENGNEIHEEIDLTQLIRDVVDSFHPLAQLKGLELICDFTEDLIITGNRDGIVRLVVNLIDNAIKYSESGSILISVERSEGETVCIRVEDSGIGIDPDHLPHIFERFYRVDPSRATEGAGLGLAIAQRIVQVHHGWIEVSSEIGQGTKFTVHLPS
jgi:heavy metal sensor kinase